jgi:hypothetical protein
VLPTSTIGNEFVLLVERNAPALTNSLLSNEETFGLAARVIARWSVFPTALDLLSATIERAAILEAQELANRLACLLPSLNAEIARFAEMLEHVEGVTVRAFLFPEDRGLDIPRTASAR